MRRPLSNAVLRLVFAILAGAPAALTACGSTSLDAADEPDADPASPRSVGDSARFAGVSADALATQLATAYCQALRACCDAAGLGAGPATCEDPARESFQAQLDENLALGLRYQPLAAARCLEAFTRYSRSCTYAERAASDAACGVVFQGTRALGESCESNGECAKVSGSGVYCAGDLGPGAHTCQRALGENQPCLLEGCDEGLFCDFSVLQCVPQRTSGECFQFEACAAGSACSPNGTCDPTLADGEPCILDLQCRSGRCGAEGCSASFVNPSSCTP